MSRFSHGPATGAGVRRPAIPAASGPAAAPAPRPQAPRPDAEDALERRWPGYLNGSYFDPQGFLRIEYVSRCLPGEENLPDDQKHGVERFVLAMAHGEPPLSTSQLRRFFQHCRGIEARLKSGASWPAVRPQFEFLDAAAADAFGKPEPKVPDVFYQFIRRNVIAVKSEKDFLQGFLPHFEALVGFASLHLRNE